MRLKDFAKASGGTVGEIVLLAPSVIGIDPEFNVRDDGPDLVAHVRMLADSIRDNGFMRTQPLTVRQAGDSIIVVDGHCRLAAVKLAMAEGCEPILTLPCLTDVRTGNEAERALQLITANSGRPLSPLEQARVVMRLHTYGWGDDLIAKKIGRTKGYVTGLLDLASASVSVHQAVVNGQVSATEATRVVRRHGSDAGAVIGAAVRQAHAEGRERARPRDVAAVTKPKKPSIQSRSERLVRIYENIADKDSIPFALRIALDDLAEEVNYAAYANGVTSGEPTTEDNIDVHGSDTGTPARLNA